MIGATVVKESISDDVNEILYLFYCATRLKVERHTTIICLTLRALD